jgi:hypothetical protein
VGFFCFCFLQFVSRKFSIHIRSLLTHPVMLGMESRSWGTPGKHCAAAHHSQPLSKLLNNLPFTRCCRSAVLLAVAPKSQALGQSTTHGSQSLHTGFWGCPVCAPAGMSRTATPSNRLQCATRSPRNGTESTKGPRGEFSTNIPGAVRLYQVPCKWR